VIWRPGQAETFVNYVSLQFVVSFYGVSGPEQAVVLDWAEIAPDTTVGAVTFRACTEYPVGPTPGLNATIRLYDGDNGNNTTTRLEAGSATVTDIRGSDTDFLCWDLFDYTAEFATPVELGDTDGVAAVPGSAFNPFGFQDLDGDGTHDFSYSIRFDLPENNEQYIWFLGVGPANTGGGNRYADIFDGDHYIGVSDVFRNLYVLLHGPGCNPADHAAPYGVLDAADIAEFVDGFLAGDIRADQALPHLQIDLADLTTFVEAFLAGCP